MKTQYLEQQTINRVKEDLPVPPSYNWFKINIHQQLRPLTANFLAMFKVTSNTIYA